MKVKVKQDFELHSNHKAYEGDILNLITVNYNYDIDRIFLILEKCGHIFNVCFNDEFEANKHLEFDYKEKRRDSMFGDWMGENAIILNQDEKENKPMELEEAIEYAKFLIRDLKADNYNETFIKALETVLQELKNTQKNYELARKQNITYKQNIHDLKYISIPKKKIEDKIKRLEEVQKEFPSNAGIRVQIITLKELLKED